MYMDDKVPYKINCDHIHRAGDQTSFLAQIESHCRTCILAHANPFLDLGRGHASARTSSDSPRTQQTARRYRMITEMSGVQFTTLIRVPFSRADFVDPQQVGSQVFPSLPSHRLTRDAGDLGCRKGSQPVEDDFQIIESK